MAKPLGKMGESTCTAIRFRKVENEIPYVRGCNWICNSLEPGIPLVNAWVRPPGESAMATE